ncbi:MAG: hypothetical protein WCJ56_15780, partial [bacterium]
RLTLDGFTEACLGGSGTISDNLSRAFDMGGRNVWLDRNHYWNTGSVPGNDGEGILCQAHGGTMVYSWASTRNVGEHPAPIHGSAMGSNFTWDVDIFGYFWGWNTTADEVGAHMNKRTPRQTVDISFTGNTAKVLTAPEGSYVEKEPVAIMKAPTDVIAEPYQDIAVKIAWKAAATNEVAFRVDRRIGTQPWGVIAYRPTQNQTHVDNPPVWVDFTAPTGVKLSYRVVAVTGKDDDSGASDATPAIMLARP